ncbi:hypothetical protein ACQP00_23910 [Dactylosporangium sp. CS-047395]|uniref:hypothetical protein n=1 Tax=Dactylosporangium sp. CS-047395 TaxID=3239936 RepID=UPI003D8DE36A
MVLALGVAQFVTGAAGGLVNAPNQALTLAHAPPGANGLSAAVLQLSQRLAASLSVAAVTGVVLASPAALFDGVLICLALIVLALLFATLDRHPRWYQPRDTHPMGRPADRPGPQRPRAADG